MYSCLQKKEVIFRQSGSYFTHLDFTWFPWNSPRKFSYSYATFWNFQSHDMWRRFFGRPDELSITCFTGKGKGLCHVPGFLQWLHHPQKWLSMPPSCRDQLRLGGWYRGDTGTPNMPLEHGPIIPQTPKWKEFLHKLLGVKSILQRDVGNFLDLCILWVWLRTSNSWK